MQHYPDRRDCSRGAEEALEGAGLERSMQTPGRWKEEGETNQTHTDVSTEWVPTGAPSDLMTTLCGLCSFFILLSLAAFCPWSAPFFSESFLFYRFPPKPLLRFSTALTAPAFSSQLALGLPPNPRPRRMFVPLSAHLLVTSSSQVIARMYAAFTNTDVLTTSRASEARFQTLQRHLHSVAVWLLSPHVPRIPGGSSPTCSLSREVHFKGKGSQPSFST